MNLSNVNEEAYEAGTAPSALLLPIIICSLAALFYLYEFVLQVAPGVMTQELMHDLAMDAAGLGMVSAFYYYSYMPMQLPAGLLFDRYGPRRLLTFAIAICALGALFFSQTNGIALASAGRLFMGIGSAFSFIGVLILVSRWFKPQYFSLLAGIVQSMSSLGAIAGAVPLATAIVTLGWRQSMLYLAIIGALLSILVWLIVRDYPPGKTKQATDNNVMGPTQNTFKILYCLLKNPQTWAIGFYAFCAWAPITVFATLWGVPYLKTLYGIHTALASSVIAVIWVSIGICCPLLGWLSDKIGRRCAPLSIVAIIGFIATVGIISPFHVPFWLMYVLCFCLGLAASGMLLCFSLVKDLSHPSNVGTAMGFNNMFTVAGGALFQPLVGFLLHWLWGGEQANDGTPVYTIAAYQHAMFILPLCYVVGFILSNWFLRESYCRSAYKA